MCQVGGYNEMKRRYPLALADTTIINSGNTSYQFRSCGRPKKGWFKIMLPADDPELPWTGLVFGLTVNAVWYWCTDQVIVQRVLAAKVSQLSPVLFHHFESWQKGRFDIKHWTVLK